jgi:hypothetical protein
MSKPQSEFPEGMPHSRDSVILVITGVEDTTIRPLRPDIPRSWFEAPATQGPPTPIQPPRGHPPTSEKS